MARSATGWIVSVSVALLFAGVGSVTPAGVATLATLLMLPVAPAVPVTLKLTLPPLGSVGIVMPAPCMAAIVTLAGAAHAAPPVGAPQLTAVTVRFATAGSVKIAPSAPAGPALATTIVYVVAAPAFTVAIPSVLLIDRLAWALMVVFAVLLLLPPVLSLVPAGAAIVATLAIAPVTPAVPVTVKVTLPVFGSVGITIPAPCINATVVDAGAGQAAPLIGVPQVTLVTVRFATTGSVNTALFAADGPLFVTTTE